MSGSKRQLVGQMGFGSRKSEPSVLVGGHGGGAFCPGHCLRTNGMRDTSRVCGTDHGVAVVGVRMASAPSSPHGKAVSVAGDILRTPKLSHLRKLPTFLGAPVSAAEG